MKTLNPEILRKQTAYHEAGHVIANLSFGYRVQAATIKPNEYDGYEGVVYCNANGRACDLAAVNLAGIVATAKMIGCDPWENPYLFDNNSTDIATANNYIDKWVKFLSKTYGESPHRKQIWGEIENKTQLLVNQNWKPIEAIADALLKMEILTYDEVIGILNAQCPDFIIREKHS